MNTRVKAQCIQTLGALALLMTLPMLAAQAQDDMEKGKPARRLTVTGQGEIKVRPDKADITIGVVTENKSSQVAAKENAEESQRVQTAVKKLGIAEKDIQTVNYSVQPVIDYNKPNERGKPTITGYRVYNQVRITIRDLPKMGDILDAATQAGSNNIEGISLGLEDSTAQEDSALEKAIREAKRKADRMAQAAGTRILGIYELNEGTNVRPIPMMYGRGGAVAEAAATPIQPGELTVSATVTIVYEIERTMRNAKASQTRPTARLAARKK
jgi:uncharacterized protein